MLQRSPRRKVFNDYAKQLMRRYPGMKDEINIRLQHLNSQWETLEKAISPCHGYQDEETMLKGRWRSSTYLLDRLVWVLIQYQRDAPKIFKKI